MYIASLKGVRPAVAKKRVKELISKVGLSKVTNRKMKKLSGGMKRRAGIAQAMLNNPAILVLDEPTAGLDPNERIRFRNLISELSEERLVLLSTHIVSDIEYIANQIWLMKDGKLVRSGTSDELIRTMPVDVWECFVRKSAVSSMAEKYKISNMKAESDGVELRIISKEKPVPEAKCVEASLEDVFLYYFGEKAGDKMLNFELKKVFSKSRNKIVILLIVVITIITSILTINRVEYVDENGNHSVGFTAAKNLRDARNEWAGYLTDDVLKK